MLSLLLFSAPLLTEARMKEMNRMSGAGNDFGKQLKDYGCHCFRKENGKRRVGFGEDIPKMDAIDDACWQLSKCYDFAKTEFGIDRKSRYKFSRLDNGEIDCSKNKNPGKEMLCNCEGLFVRQMVGNPKEVPTDGKFEDMPLFAKFDMSFWGNKKNLKNMKKSGGKWDAAETCVAGVPDFHCHDGVKNPSEEGTDCGGVCAKQCDEEHHVCNRTTVEDCVGMFAHKGGCRMFSKEFGLSPETAEDKLMLENIMSEIPETCMACDNEQDFDDVMAETCDIAPFCDRIRADGACGKNCEYAFSQPDMSSIMPIWLQLEFCRTPMGKYTELCPAQCPTIAPLCEEIKKNGACEESCTYAFSDAKLFALIPDWMAIEVCKTPEGKYTALCPEQCAK